MKNTRKQRMNKRAWREVSRIDNTLYGNLACGKDASSRGGSLSNLSTVVTSDFNGYYERIETKKHLSTSQVYSEKS